MNKWNDDTYVRSKYLNNSILLFSEEKQFGKKGCYASVIYSMNWFKGVTSQQFAPGPISSIGTLRAGYSKSIFLTGSVLTNRRSMLRERNKIGSEKVI